MDEQPANPHNSDFCAATATNGRRTPGAVHSVTERYDSQTRQKFMLTAVTGYVFFAFVAAWLRIGQAIRVAWLRQFVIILLQWGAVLVFIFGSLGYVFDDSARLDLAALQPLPGTVWLALLGACAVALLSVHGAVAGWWSPLPWLRGVIGATAVCTAIEASRNTLYALLPDWRFVGASLVLWLVCLLLAELSLTLSQGDRAHDPSSQLVREVLRVSAALPALLVFLMGFRLW